MALNLRIFSVNLGSYLYVTNLFNLKRYRGVIDTEWYHQFTNLIKTYDKNDDGKITMADGEENYFEYMGNVDLDHDGKIDENKLKPEQGPYLNPVIYLDHRRMQIGFTVSF